MPRKIGLSFELSSTEIFAHLSSAVFGQNVIVDNIAAQPPTQVAADIFFEHPCLPVIFRIPDQISCHAVH
jgi:hypothetical protein